MQFFYFDSSNQYPQHVVMIATSVEASAHVHALTGGFQYPTEGMKLQHRNGSSYILQPPFNVCLV